MSRVNQSVSRSLTTQPNSRALIGYSCTGAYAAAMRSLAFSIICSVILAPVLPAGADPADEASRILEAAWSATGALEPAKQDALKPALLETARRAGGDTMMQVWATRMGVQPLPAAGRTAAYPDFGWKKAEKILLDQGVDALINFARQKRAPLHFGRGEALKAAGVHLIETQPGDARRVNLALLEIARSADPFERPGLADAAAELAMTRCDLSLLSDAVALSDDPDNIRYAFWRARITGDAVRLTGHIQTEAISDDTRFVRQVLSGYRAILDLGYCDRT